MSPGQVTAAVMTGARGYSPRPASNSPSHSPFLGSPTMRSPPPPPQQRQHLPDGSPRRFTITPPGSPPPGRSSRGSVPPPNGSGASEHTSRGNTPSPVGSGEPAARFYGGSLPVHLYGSEVAPVPALPYGPGLAGTPNFMHQPNRMYNTGPYFDGGVNVPFTEDKVNLS